jgi:hypothetical protein
VAGSGIVFGFAWAAFGAWNAFHDEPLPPPTFPVIKERHMYSIPAKVLNEIARTQPLRTKWARRLFAATGDERTVVSDPRARYFGTELRGGELTPGDGARIGAIDFDTWFATQPQGVAG